MIQVSNLTFKYNKNSDNYIFNNANAEFEKGKVYAVWGESGSGKSTLLSLLGGLERIQDGDITFDNKSIRDIEDYSLRSKYVSYIFQDYLLLNHLNAVDNVVTAMEISKTEQTGRKETAKKILLEVGISEDEMRRNIKKLSGGQQQRIAIARAIATGNDYIIADEPTGNLDKSNAFAILEILKKLAYEQNKCVIVATHSAIIRESADKTYIVDNQKLTEV